MKIDEMRELLFKAKRKDTGEWVEGNLIINEQDGTAYIGYIFSVRDGVIEDFDLVEVDPKTLCRYTGLNDKNDQRIWENDIFKFDAYGNHYVGFVVIEKGNTGIKCKNICPFLDNVIEKRNADRIGNIFDNKELLGR